MSMDDVWNKDLSKSARLKSAELWYFDRGKTPAWTWLRDSELFDLHDQCHYRQTSEYKGMVKFFDRLDEKFHKAVEKRGRIVLW